MSLREVSKVYVLGEDAAHRSFIRAWLTKNDVHPGNIHTIDPPANKSGGISFVLKKCKETVKEASFRDRSKAKTRVVIAIDADDGTVEERLSEIKREVSSIGDDHALDVICVLVPRRHIETWVHALGPENPQVDEKLSYKHKSTEEVRLAARRLADLSSAPSAPPSLVHGYEQLQRFKAG